MKHLYFALALLLSACLPFHKQEVPVAFTYQKIPYSGDALLLSEKAPEQIIQALKDEYPIWDPITQYEAGDSQEQKAFLANFGGHLTQEHMDELLKLIYRQNDLLEGPRVLPEDIVDVFAPVNSCEEFLTLYLSSWPKNFHESSSPLYNYTNPATGDQLLISGLIAGSNKSLSTECTEHWNDIGGTYHSETHMSLFYDENGHLTYILTEDTDVDFTNGPIFQLSNLKTKEQWGVRILASQMAVPHFEYFYYKQ